MIKAIHHQCLTYPHATPNICPMSSMSRAGKTMLRFQIPPELIPLRVERAVLTVDLNVQARTFEVFAGKDLGYEASMTKIMWSETFRKVSDAYEAVLGTGFQVAEPQPGMTVGELTAMALWSRSCTIWGGSQQVQRTIVAERVLGLPR